MRANKDFQGKVVAPFSTIRPLSPSTRATWSACSSCSRDSRSIRKQVAGTIDRLFSSGLYDDIQVDATPSGNGVTLRFITRPRRFIGHVGAHGDIKDPPNRAVIINEAQLASARPTTKRRWKTPERTIEHELRQNGLFLAHVGVATIEDPDTHQMTIRFLVEAGKRAKYETPVITGETKLPDDTIVAATGWRIRFIHLWRHVTQALTEKGIDGIENKYAKKDRLTASVDLTGMDYDAARNRARAHLQIEAGPKITIKALEAKVSKGNASQVRAGLRGGLGRQRSADRRRRQLTGLFSIEGLSGCGCHVQTRAAAARPGHDRLLHRHRPAAQAGERDNHRQHVF